MKRILSCILVFTMIFALCACSKNGSNNSSKADVNSNAELYHPSLTEDEANNTRAKQEERSSSNSKVTYYDDINSLILAIKNDKINLAYLGESVARYICERDDTLGYVITNYSLPNEYSLCMRAEDIATINLFNKAISSMKEDGTLASLEQKYIENVIAGNEPEKIELPQVAGRKTISVAVTGDVPPMDYIANDGNAAGFNVAMLKELADRCDLNITLVSLNSQARAMSLTSGKVDCLFWTVIEQSPDAKMKYKDVPKDAIISDAYYSTQGVNIYSKNNQKTMNYLNKNEKIIVEKH